MDEQIEHQHLVLRIFEGRNLYDDGEARDGDFNIHVEANLDGKHVQETQRMPFNSQDLEWKIPNDIIQSFNKVQIKVFKLKADDTKELIGETFMLLRDAVQLSNSLSSSRMEPATWKELQSDDNRDAAIFCSLVLENNLNESHVDTQDDKMVLKADRGYFVLGPEDAATDMFYFNIFLIKVSKDFPVSESDKCFISFDLFGSEVNTDEFSKPADYVMEVATVKIYSNLTAIIKYFKGRKAFTFYVRSSAHRTHGKFEADFGSAMSLYGDLETLLQSDEIATYDCLLAVHLMDNQRTDARVAARLSLGKVPDPALNPEIEIDNKVMENASHALSSQPTSAVETSASLVAPEDTSKEAINESLQNVTKEATSKPQNVTKEVEHLSDKKQSSSSPQIHSLLKAHSPDPGQSSLPDSSSKTGSSNPGQSSLPHSSSKTRSPNPGQSSLPHSLPKIRSLDREALMQIAIVEIQQWKKEEKRKFMSQLQDEKAHQMSLLSDEWTARASEYKKEEDARMANVIETEAKTLAFWKKLKDHERALDIRGKKLSDRAKQLDEKEMNAENKTKLEMEMAGLQVENSGLKRQILKYERKINELQLILREKEKEGQRLEKEKLHPTPIFAKPLVTNDNSISSQSSMSSTTTQTVVTREFQKLLEKTKVYGVNDTLVKIVHQRLGEKENEND